MTMMTDADLKATRFVRLILFISTCVLYSGALIIRKHGWERELGIALVLFTIALVAMESRHIQQTSPLRAAVLGLIGACFLIDAVEVLALQYYRLGALCLYPLGICYIELFLIGKLRSRPPA